MPRWIWPLGAVLWLSGCGYVGDVQPPALNIPMAVPDLSAVQRGAKLKFSFTPPAMTTDLLPLDKPGEIDLRVGLPGDGAFDINAWANGAARVTATAPQAEADVAAFAGKEIFAAVRTMGPKGRWSAWSNVVAISVAPALAKPVDFKAASDAAGVRLIWTHQGPEGARYRIFRQSAEEEQPRLIEPKAAKPPYVDGKAEFGKPYKYQVQAAIEAGKREAESELSETVEITPVDSFAPAVPAGLNALAGLNAIELAWDRNTETDFRGYHVYRAVSGGEFERIGELTEAPAFSDKSIQAGTSYRYAVAAVDQKGNESGKSEPVAITAPQ